MEKKLRILLLEDRVSDANLVEFELQEAGIAYTAKRVMTEKDFVMALEDFSPDIILSDYDLPQYDGTAALAEAKARCPDIPFILITGAVGEDRAIEMLTSGAKDYVMKNRLHRLAPAVRRVLVAADERKARKQAEEELRDACKNLQVQVEKMTAELHRKRAAHRQTEKERNKPIHELNKSLAKIKTLGELLSRSLSS